MSYSRSTVDDTGGASYSNLYGQIPRIITASTTEGYYAAPHSCGSWTSLGSFPANNTQDGEQFEYDQFSGMDIDQRENVNPNAGLQSLSASPNSILTPSEDMVLDYVNIHVGQMPSRINPASVDSFSQMDQGDNGLFHYEPDHHPHHQAPMVPQEGFHEWTFPEVHNRTLAHHQYARHPQMPSYSQYNFINQTPGQEPWTGELPPRGHFPATTDTALLDPESDPLCRMTGTFVEAPSPISPTYIPQNDFRGGSLSPLSTEVCVPLSPSDHASFTDQPIGLVGNHQHSHGLQRGRSVSAYSSDGFAKMSPPPPASYQPNSPHNIPHPAPPPVVKLEYSFSQSSNASSNTSPVMLHAHRNPVVDSPISETSSRHLSPHSNRMLLNKPGGRPLGSHLQPEVAADANMMRKVVACWHCVLQRDKCGPGETCDRCRKRQMRPNAEHGLGCVRTSVRDLADNFLPVLWTSMHKHDVLKSFCARHVGKWGSTEYEIHLACGRNLPMLPCRVYEFAPLDKELLRSYQYVQDPETGKGYRKELLAPPLGIQHQSTKDEQIYDKFIDKIVVHHLDAFVRMLYEQEPNDFALQLLLLMTRFKPKEKKEEKLLKEIYRLLVVTYIMEHTFIIMDPNRDSIFAKLKSYSPGSYPSYCSPRMANRQIKFLFCHLHNKILGEVLNKIQQIFHGSGKGSPRWSEAFCAVLGLAIASEEVQKCVHTIMDYKARIKEVSKEDSVTIAEDACKEIDQSFQFVMNIFRWKYSRNENPLRDWQHHDWSSRFKDPGVVDFTQGIVWLVTDKRDYLVERQYVDISEDNQGKFTSRLVARFLLNFWNPS